MEIWLFKLQHTSVLKAQPSQHYFNSLHLPVYVTQWPVRVYWVRAAEKKCFYLKRIKVHNNSQILPGPKVTKLFTCSTQMSMKLILLINVKMPTIVGILTFISMINTTSERLEARHFFICQYFIFYEQLKFRAQLSWAWKKFYKLRAWCLATTEQFSYLELTFQLSKPQVNDNYSRPPPKAGIVVDLYDTKKYLQLLKDYKRHAVRKDK